jgi:signal transduction histidine kinase
MYLARFTNNSNKIEQVKNEIEEYIANINVSESYGSLQFLLGNYYRTIDERIRATENYLNSIEYFKSTDDFLLMSEAYGAIADLYGELEMHAKKADVLDKRLQVIEDNNINADLYGVYMGMAWAKYDNGEYDDAEKYMKLVQEHASQQNIFTAAKENQSLKAHILMDKGQYEEAIPIFKKVLNISLDKNYRETDEWEAYRLSYCYFKIQDLSNALKYGLISEEVLNPGNPRLRKLLNLHLSEIYDAVGNMEKSFVYLKKFKDGLINSQTNDISNKIMQTEISRLLDKNKEEVALLEKERFVKEQQNKTQRLWIFSISGAFLSALLIVLILYRNNKIKQKNNIQLERKKNQLEITLGQLKTTQSQLIQSEKMASLGELTAGIAHEIQNPLNFVNNFSEINQELIEEVEEEIENGNLAEIKEIIVDLKENEQKISEHGKRADSIVKGMLLHSRTSTGEKVFKDINGLCDEFVRLSYHGIRAKNRNFNADFELNLDPDLPQIKIIPQDIGRVLLNIINNAFCAASEEALRVHQIISNSEAKSDSNFMAKVTVSTKLLDDKIQISISDNGPGIPEEIKDKIFQPFFTTKPTGEGTGLGLSLAYDIVQAHGGNIDIDSEVGRGSNFIITLPYIENK